MRNLAFDENFMLIMKRERNERLSKRPVDPECELIAVHQSLTCLVYQKLFGGGQMVDNEQVLKVLGKYRMLLEEASKERNHFVAVDALRDLGDLHYDIIGGGNGACLEQSRQFWSKSVELLLMSGLPAGSSGGSIKSWLQFSAFDLVGQKITLERCLKTIMDLGKLSMFAYRKDYDKKLEMAVVGSQLLHSLLCSRVNDPFDETLLTNFVKNHADLNELRNVALLLKSFQVLAKSLLDYSTDYAESALLMALFLVSF
jgi:hypothetical protein